MMKLRVGFLAAGWLLCAGLAGAEELVNHDFETGDLSGWTVDAGLLTAETATNTTFNRNYAARLHGTFASENWVTSSISQRIAVNAGDDLYAVGGIYWKEHTVDSGSATGYVELVMEGADGSTQRWENVQEGWIPFSVSREVRAIADTGFESGGFSFWKTGCDDLVASVQTNEVDAGEYALKLEGNWSGWSFNQVYQTITLNEGEMVAFGGRINVKEFTVDGGWAVAGYKVELNSENYAEATLSAPTAGWEDLANWTVINEAGNYTFRAMICGDTTCDAEVYFDDMELLIVGYDPGTDTNVTLTVRYIGFSGGAMHETTVDLYLDSVMLEGSTANPESPTNVFARLISAAAAIAADPDEEDIPPVVYPKLNAYGYPGGHTNPVAYPAHVEAAVSGWRMRYMTNDTVLAVTNTITMDEFDGNGPGYMEFDQYIYCDKYWHTDRGAAIDVRTNAPYFTLGDRDNSGAEFGAGPFENEHTFRVGVDALTNFPRFMGTPGNGQWPSRLHIVFDENLSQFDRSRDKYFVLSTVTTNGEASNVKSIRFYMLANDADGTNLAFNTQEIHMGWAAETETFGMVDYPNCTYQDHNEVALRTGWKYGLLDADGWFMNSVARGSATIEPIDLYMLRQGNWIPNIYEEYLYMWPNAASGVRSVFDDDYDDRLPGPISYHVGFKIGHRNGTNELGEAQYPQVIEIRGNGYFRMTDYGGVMGGSFRPVSADIFGLYQYMEDAPLIPEAYTRLVPRTTPSSEPDNSYLQTYMPIRSKTNHWFTGAIQMDSFYAPDTANEEGAYFEMDTYLYANRAVVRSNDGPLNAFAQVDMFWRGEEGVNTGSEGHDFDALVVKKSDGEWITHLPINPPTNIYHRTLSSFGSGDAVYIMQQDRGRDTYGYATESPYRKVSTFEITMLSDGGKDMTLDLYEQNTISEINDNCVIACAVAEDFEQGDNLHFKYRYRGIYAPGVTIINPNTPDGGENWSNQTYTIEYYATDGEDKLLQTSIYYGNGTDEDWKLINTNGLIVISTNTNKGRYDWDVSGVETGAYYIKVEAERVIGGKKGFDVSDARLRVGGVVGFPNNGSTNVTVVTNAYGYVGTNMSFETGNVLGWSSAGDDLDIYAASGRAADGVYACRMVGTWDGWSWNNVMQEVPCVSGEVLQVQASIYLDTFERTGTTDIRCGMKMEDTNSLTAPSEVTITQTATTGTWLNITMERTAPYTGTQRLILFVCGEPTTASADVWFDHIRVASTNNGTVVTNRIRTGYWEGDASVDVSAQDTLSFFVQASSTNDDPTLWVADEYGITNSVALAAYLNYRLPIEQRVDIPWTAFSTVDKEAVKSLGIHSSGSATTEIARVRSVARPLDVSSAILNPSAYNLSGVPHYNPGETVLQEITLENTTAQTLTGLTVQILQEYGENQLWLDASHGEVQSVKLRRGDRLGGAFELRLSNQTLTAGGALVLTNAYTLPRGRMIDHTRFAIKSDDDWFIFRNYAAYAQVRVVVRDAAGDNLLEQDALALYSMDDDFDLDNDGLTDDYEQQYSGSVTGLNASADMDGDGFNTTDEFIAGTDPTDAGSVPAVETVSFTEGTGAAQIVFDSVLNRLYWVEYCQDLLEPEWVRITSNYVAGTGAQMMLQDAESEGVTNRFYKLGTKIDRERF